MKKKGQLVSQVIIFILALLIGSMVLLFGYQSLQKILEQARLAKWSEFRIDLENTVDSLAYNSQRIKTLSPPGNFQEMCFTDLNYLLNEPKPPLAGSRSEALWTDEKYRIINNSVYDEVEKNMFFIPDGRESLYLGDLVVTDGFVCLQASAGKFNVGFRSLGNRTQIIVP